MLVALMSLVSALLVALMSLAWSMSLLASEGTTIDTNSNHGNLKFLPLRYVVQYRYRIVCVCAITVGQRPTPTRWVVYSDGVPRKLFGKLRILGWYVDTVYSANRPAAPNPPTKTFHTIFW